MPQASLNAEADCYTTFSTIIKRDGRSSWVPEEELLPDRISDWEDDPKQ